MIVVIVLRANRRSLYVSCTIAHSLISNVVIQGHFDDSSYPTHVGYLVSLASSLRRIFAMRSCSAIVLELAGPGCGWGNVAVSGLAILCCGTASAAAGGGSAFRRRASRPHRC